LGSDEISSILEFVCNKKKKESESENKNYSILVFFGDLHIFNQNSVFIIKKKKAYTDYNL
jgi:hypothetical protein